MKKIVLILSLILSVQTYALASSTPVESASSGDFIVLDYDTFVKSVFKYINPDRIPYVLKTYLAILEKNNDMGITPSELWSLCSAGGLNITNATDRQTCQNFISELLTKPRFFSVCKIGLKTSSTDNNGNHCIRAFKNIQVQQAQAKNLAVEYAKQKFNDDIVCDMNVNTRLRGPRIQDDIKCASKKNKTHYEFVFDDAKESNVFNGQFTEREFGRGLCIVHGGEPEAVLDKTGKYVFSTVSGQERFWSKCNNISDCTDLNKKIKKWGYTAEHEDTYCKISYIKDNIDDVSPDYYATFDGYKFSVYYRGYIIKSWDAVSGRGKTPQDDTRTICQTPKYQSCHHVGPIPAGTYYAKQNDIQYLANIRIGTYTSNDLTHPEALVGRAHNESWGDARVILHPDSATNLFGREPNMYIHGGDYAGSAGCIDLTTNINDFISWFEKQEDFSTLKIDVNYGPSGEICKNCPPDATVCVPCPCITEDEVAEKCVYL